MHHSCPRCFSGPYLVCRILVLLYGAWILSTFLFPGARGGLGYSGTPYELRHALIFSGAVSMIVPNSLLLGDAAYWFRMTLALACSTDVALALRALHHASAARQVPMGLVVGVYALYLGAIALPPLTLWWKFRSMRRCVLAKLRAVRAIRARGKTSRPRTRSGR